MDTGYSTTTSTLRRYHWWAWGYRVGTGRPTCVLCRIHCVAADIPLHIVVCFFGANMFYMACLGGGTSFSGGATHDLFWVEYTGVRYNMPLV